MIEKYNELPVFNKITLIGQAILTLVVLIFLFIYIGLPEIKNVLKTLLLLLFLIMAYNNHKIFKRKRFTIYNLLFVIVILIEVLFT